jgi:hypothetical protein
MMLHKKTILFFTLFLVQCSVAIAQSTHKPVRPGSASHTQSICLLVAATPAQKLYPWQNIIQIGIDQKKYPGKFKVVTDILNSMAADPAGRQIL